MLSSAPHSQEFSDRHPPTAKPSLGCRPCPNDTVAWSMGFAAAGAVAVWFSHPAVFILAGVGSTLFVSALLERLDSSSVDRTSTLNTARTNSVLSEIEKIFRKTSLPAPIRTIS